MDDREPLIQDEKLHTLITKLHVPAIDFEKYIDWLTRLMMASVESSGVLSAEIVPPACSEAGEWMLIEHFETPQQMQKWLDSSAHQKLRAELASDLKVQGVHLVESTNPADASHGEVSVAVVTRVKPGQEEAYFAYERQYQLAQGLAPGFKGAYMQPPTKGAIGTWVSVLRFDSQKSLHRWLTSEERKKLVVAAGSFVRSTDFHNVTTSYPGFFPGESDAKKGPANWKTALLILLGLYPSVMLTIKYLMPLMKGIHPAFSNFLGNILTVSFTTWISMPLFIYIYARWLFPTENTSKWVNLASLFSLLVLFALEIAFFRRFF